MAWIGAAIGAVGGLLANKGSNGGNTTSVQNSAPWEGTVPYLLKGYREADAIYDRGMPTEAQNLLRARGIFGSPVTQEAQGLAQRTLRGDYLNSNPFTEGAVKDAMGLARSQINSQFGGNNFGSSAHQEWLGRGLMNASLPYLNQNYENERGRQFAALSQTPALQGLDYQNIGAVQQAENMPFDFLGRYNSFFTGAPGGTSTMQTPYFTNPVNSAVGGALLGNQLYNQYTSNSSPGAYTGNAAPF